MPGMLCPASAISESMRPKMRLKKSMRPDRSHGWPEPDPLLEIDAVVDLACVDREPYPDREAVTDRLADRLVHHDAEARAVLERTAENVGAAVGA